MAPLVSVLTATIPSRAHLLAECRQSVRAQTTRVAVEHLVELDADRAGYAPTLNRLAARAKGTYLLPLEDDDLILPGCIRTLLALAGPRTIVYPKPLVWGEADNQFVMAPPAIPSFALIPRAVWYELGGYNERLNACEDRDLWERAIKAGVGFVREDKSPTWVYRFHGGNKSRHNGVAH